MHGLLSLLSSLPFWLAFFLMRSRTASYCQEGMATSNWPPSGYCSLLAVVVGFGFLGHYIADSVLQEMGIWHW